MEFLENNPIVVPIGIVLFIIIFMGLRIVQEYQRAVVFRLGRYSRTGGPGLFWIIPFLEYSRTVDVRTITEAIEPQETITRDSVTIKVNAVVWYKVTSPSKATIAVRDFNRAVNQASLTSLRNVIGQHDLDLLGNEGRIDRQDAVHAFGVLRRERRDRGGGKAAHRRYGLDVGLNAGAASGIGAGHDQHSPLHDFLYAAGCGIASMI